VPQSWSFVGGTKAVDRFHTPQVIKLIEKMRQHTERLSIESKTAWQKFLTRFSLSYHKYAQIVRKLAELDVLLSLSR